MAQAADRLSARNAAASERMQHKQVLYTELGYAALTGIERITQTESRTRVSDRLDSFAAMYGYQTRGNTGFTLPYDSKVNIDGSKKSKIQLKNETTIMREIKHAGDARSPREFVGTANADGELEMPKTWVERRKAKRLYKRGEQKAWVHTFADRDGDIFGATQTLPDSYLREKVARAIFGNSAAGQIPTVSRQERHDHEKYGPADLPGVNRRARSDMKKQVKRDVRAGRLTHQEGKLRKAQIGGQDPVTGFSPKYGELASKQKSPAIRKADQRFRHTANEEYVYRWRDAKRTRTQQRSARLQTSAADHRTAVAAAKTRRANAKIARAQRKAAKHNSTNSTP
jgi:hypothetical protein